MEISERPDSKTVGGMQLSDEKFTTCNTNKSLLGFIKILFYIQQTLLASFFNVKHLQKIRGWQQDLYP
jgi:hypothetical protein